MTNSVPECDPIIAVRTISTPWITVEDIELRPGARVPAHDHEGSHVVLVWHGTMAEIDRGRLTHLSPGMVRTSGSQRHELRVGPSCFRCVLLTGASAQNLLPAMGPQRFLGGPDIYRLAQRFLRSVCASGSGDALMVELHAAEMAAQIDRRALGRSAPPPLWLRQIRERLHDDIDLPDLDALARPAGVHPRHIGRAFREHYGLSMSGSLRRIRARRALTMLRTSIEPLARVAVRAGYFDQAHMTRELRHLLGQTPARVRAAR
jgi:AraC family transcriptional regulator